MRARSCIKCREYVLIEPSNPNNIEIINKFEKEHRGHTLITSNFEEIKGSYKPYGKEEEQEEKEE
ncbi:MAG: hypothetical protein GF317_18325 [Candidatus Lokiarchaeota archaeon]|nr:hypothetical protein [Candidatus Lokiarchaeota archaeon]MBD3201472.1 hypothetical protein [Candidatus Lokiarchaeota archaeon]